MTNAIFNDDAIRAARYALDGLTARQEVISNNVANIDTPGYNAQQVDFESTMKIALDNQTRNVTLSKTNSGHLGQESKTSDFMSVTNRLGGAYREDGNNVDIDTELMEMSATGIQYQAISQVLSKKLILLKTIAQGG